jgi:hypothetical protein
MLTFVSMTDDWRTRKDSLALAGCAAFVFAASRLRSNCALRLVLTNSLLNPAASRLPGSKAIDCFKIKIPLQGVF